MKTAVLKRKGVRVGVAVAMLLSLLISALAPMATLAQGEVPVSGTLDTGIEQSLTPAAAPSLAPLPMDDQPATPATTSAPAVYEESAMYPAAPFPTAAAATGDTMTTTSATTGTKNLETKLTIQNLTTGQDATMASNAPGDMLHITATIKNLGPAALTNYTATILAEKLFRLGSVINPGEGTLKEDKQMEYPPISQSGDCNCTAKFEVTVNLKPTICTDMKDLVEGGIAVSIEDQLKKINVLCAEPNPTPTLTAMTEEEKVAPQNTKTGPELIFILAIAGVLGYVMWRRKAEVTE